MFKRTAQLALVGSCLCSAPLPAATIYVDDGATGANNGTSWVDAYTSLSTAINNAAVGDEVWVAAGTYDGPISLKNDVKLYGGFAGHETTASQSDPASHPTYITGRGQTRVVESIDNDSSAVLRGFYIIDGFIDRPEYGGGMQLKNSRAMIVGCVFTANHSVALGGALFNRDGSPTFVNCRFDGNDGGWGSGALFNWGGAPTFVNCLFTGNRAWEGGAVGNLSGSPNFINCTFVGNVSAKGHGGAMFDNPGKAKLRNCIVWDNSAVRAGSHTIFNNPSIGAKTSVTFSDVQGGWPGTGNIDADPLFVDVLAKDYRLQTGSPCRDAGRTESLPNDRADIDWDGSTAGIVPKDLALNPRINGTSVDIGAHEWTTAEGSE